MSIYPVSLSDIVSNKDYDRIEIDDAAYCRVYLSDNIYLLIDMSIQIRLAKDIAPIAASSVSKWIIWNPTVYVGQIINKQIFSETNTRLVSKIIMASTMNEAQAESISNKYKYFVTKYLTVFAKHINNAAHASIYDLLLSKADGDSVDILGLCNITKVLSHNIDGNVYCMLNCISKTTNGILETTAYAYANTSRQSVEFMDTNDLDVFRVKLQYNKVHSVFGKEIDLNYPLRLNHQDLKQASEIIADFISVRHSCILGITSAGYRLMLDTANNRYEITINNEQQESPPYGILLNICRIDKNDEEVRTYNTEYRLSILDLVNNDLADLVEFIQSVDNAPDDNQDNYNNNGSLLNVIKRMAGIMTNA